MAKQLRMASPTRPLLLLVLTLLASSASARRKVPNVPWNTEATFLVDKELSDEFRGSTLDESKWDPHGIRNPDTGCPKWNGPPSLQYPDFSVLFSTPTDPVTRQRIHQQYRLRNGRLELEISEKPLSYFLSREYYCDTTTFTCNHDSSINCFATDANGQPLFADAARTRYRGVVHDKCKKEPHCIPHPEFVTKKARVYKRLAGPHLSSVKSFKYGFVETRVLLPRSPIITAVWMHDDNMVNGYCRYKKPNKQLECPSLIRSRRWQEIDMVEAMNTRLLKRKFIPNIHSFTMFKGEFSSPDAKDHGDGSMGGGPIILNKGVFNYRVPNFDDVPAAARESNDWHMNQGSVYDLDADWASRAHTVGMYWSPNEIRYYVDGKEVKRMKNTIIHQPMRLDISAAINIAWGKEKPTSQQLRRRARVMYIRKWSVFTNLGAEPPSNLTLDTQMESTFKNKYGNKLLGAFNRFPVMDDLTMDESIPEPDDVVAAEPAPGSEPAAPVRELVNDWRGTNVTAHDIGGDYILDPTSPSAIRMTRLDRRLRRAGGPGNLRFSRRRRRMTQRERRVALSNPDRIAEVQQLGTIPEVVDDAAITVFEFTDPNKDAAGWSTINGLGTQLDLA